MGRVACPLAVMECSRQLDPNGLCGFGCEVEVREVRSMFWLTFRSGDWSISGFASRGEAEDWARRRALAIVEGAPTAAPSPLRRSA